MMDKLGSEDIHFECSHYMSSGLILSALPKSKSPVNGRFFNYFLQKFNSRTGGTELRNQTGAQGIRSGTVTFGNDGNAAVRS